MPIIESHLPRAASLTRATSFASWSAFQNAVTGTRSLVSLSTITAMPVPQLGWQPQLSCPQSDGVPECGHRNPFLGLLVHHHGHAGAAIGMAAAAQLPPVGLRAVNQVAPIGEGRDEGNREPIARGLAQAHLVHGPQ